MDVDDGNKGPARPLDDDYEQPMAGPLRHCDAYTPDDDGIPTDAEIDEDVEDKGKPAGSDNDKECLGD